MSEIIAIEIYKKYPDCIQIWTKEKIKRAFNFGAGTEKDFAEFMHNNRKYCKFITDKNEIARELNNNVYAVIACSRAGIR